MLSGFCHPKAGKEFMGVKNEDMHCQSSLADEPVIFTGLTACFSGSVLLTLPRGSLVDSTVTPFYHCISRCVRRICCFNERTGF